MAKKPIDAKAFLSFFIPRLLIIPLILGTNIYYASLKEGLTIAELFSKKPQYAIDYFPIFTLFLLSYTLIQLFLLIEIFINSKKRASTKVYAGATLWLSLNFLIFAGTIYYLIHLKT